MMNNDPSFGRPWLTCQDYYMDQLRHYWSYYSPPRCPYCCRTIPFATAYQQPLIRRPLRGRLSSTHRQLSLCNYESLRKPTPLVVTEEKTRRDSRSNGLLNTENEVTKLTKTQWIALLDSNPEKFGTYDVDLLEKAILDCYGRFLLNLPGELLKDHEAHWWYVDFWYDTYPKVLPYIQLKNFGLILWDFFPVLQEYIPEKVMTHIMRSWVDYCRTIPLRGAILINEDLSKCLLGWKGSRWTFPRGKLDEKETDHICAAREVYEEVGFDISPLIDPNLFIEKVVGKQTVKLYIVPGVDDTVALEPQKRKEISLIRWMSIQHLCALGRRRGKNVLATENISKMGHVLPFLKNLQAWVRAMEPFQRNGSVDTYSFVKSLDKTKLRKLQQPDKTSTVLESAEEESECTASLESNAVLTACDDGRPKPEDINDIESSLLQKMLDIDEEHLPVVVSKATKLTGLANGSQKIIELAGPAAKIIAEAEKLPAPVPQLPSLKKWVKLSTDLSGVDDYPVITKSAPRKSAAVTGKSTRTKQPVMILKRGERP